MSAEASLARLKELVKTNPNMRLRSAMFEVLKDDVLEALRAPPVKAECPRTIGQRLLATIGTISAAIGKVE